MDPAHRRWVPFFAPGCARSSKALVAKQQRGPAGTHLVIGLVLIVYFVPFGGIERIFGYRREAMKK